MRCQGVISWFRAFVAVSILTLAPSTVHSLQALFDNRVKIQPSPLIGGPEWLPVHCKVVLGDRYVFDFIPLNAASKQTIQRLTGLQAVPAIVRTIQKNQSQAEVRTDFTGKWDGDGDELTKTYVEKAVRFCEDYDRDLHLIKNNCWSFAFDLLVHISQDE
ncbi:unnamed protein product [Pseudo-nitzschia multistriata]|uniref:PPPDE domain-containing protein n=1 Tax=Pseudo-nitzschia multistriata TaxID=183589 RepID=A0A448Z173_9STRA|nr:unnamed protein product [Pseudo-nitzschia multistriata]